MPQKKRQEKGLNFKKKAFKWNKHISRNFKISKDLGNKLVSNQFPCDISQIFIQDRDREKGNKEGEREN